LLETLADGTTKETPLPSALTPVHTDSVLQAADPVRALTDWLAFEKRGENDDRTLCLATASAFGSAFASSRPTA
jgi:hypothetical protein